MNIFGVLKVVILLFLALVADSAVQINGNLHGSQGLGLFLLAGGAVYTFLAARFGLWVHVHRVDAQARRY